MSIYAELLEKAGASLSKGMKKLVIFLILLFIAALVAAYFIGRNAGKQAVLHSLQNRITEVCDVKDDDCGGSDDSAVIYVPDHSEAYMEMLRRLKQATERNAARCPPYVVPAPAGQPRNWEI